MDWLEQGEVWPNREFSRFVNVRPHRWHVQVAEPDGTARGTLLLLHGTAGATHSWRDLLPLLRSEGFRLIAPDLPGHGFTRAGTLQRSGLSLMSIDLAALVEDLSSMVTGIVGHSAGAALALELSQTLRPNVVVGLNAALDPFPGLGAWAMPTMARSLAMNPFSAPMVSRLMTEQVVRQLIEGTGSRLDPVGLALYRMVLSDSGHIDGALAMMAQWSLSGFRARLPEIEAPALLVAGEGDKAVPPDNSERAASDMPLGRCEVLSHLGHLAHEEEPSLICARIVDFISETEKGRPKRTTL